MKRFLGACALIISLASCGNAATSNTVTPKLNPYAKYVLGLDQAPSCDVKVNLVYENGEAAFAPIEGKVSAGSQFVFTPPELSGYSANYPFINELVSDSKTFVVTYSTTSTWNGSTSVFLGSGTEASPYIINNAAKLAYLAKQVNSGQKYADKYFSLTANIDLAGLPWEPIGTDFTASYGKPFAGIFKGNGHLVYNLRSSYPEKAGIGLFGALSGNGRIENIAVDGEVEAKTRAGVLIGCLNSQTSSLKDIRTYGKSTCLGDVANTGYCGGVVGVCKGNLDNCANYASIESHYSDNGGVAGICYKEINNCVNYAALSKKGNNYFGGIVGTMQTGSSASNCLNYGYIKAKGTGYVGGLFGRCSGSIAECVNYGRVNGDTQILGGVVGQLSKASISESINYGLVENENGSDTGGVIGISSNGNISACLNYGKAISRGLYLGGVMGRGYTAGQILSECENYGEVSGFQQAGGVAGYQTQDLKDSKNYGKVSGQDQIGGVVGHNLSGRVSGCENFGEVSGSLKWTAGIVGHNTDSASISTSANHGYISAPTCVGGIAGYNGSGSSVAECENDGEIVGDSYVGELIGYDANKI